MNPKLVIVITVVATSAATFQLYGHDDDLRSGNIVRTIALVSEEVARQKLKTFGVKSIRELREVDGRFVAQGKYNERAIEVEIDVQSGVLRERDKYESLVLPEKAAQSTIRDFTLKIERDDIVRAPLMIEPFVPARPEAVRPLGDRPVKEGRVVPEKPPGESN